MYDGSNGFIIPTREPDSEDPSSEAFTYAAEGFYQVMREEVCPIFYERDANGIPQRWVQMIINSIASLAPLVCSPRMIKEYNDQLYS
jgi:starch phosphorylase